MPRILTSKNISAKEPELFGIRLWGNLCFQDIIKKKKKQNYGTITQQLVKTKSKKRDSQRLAQLK